MTSLETNCPSCGAALAHALQGLCPHCLWGDSVSAEDDGLIPGHTLGAELARGGMGIVYAARQLSPQRNVAVKMLRSHLLEQSAMRDRFRQEGYAAAALQHPGILPVYEVGETDGAPWFTMMLAAGGTLAARRADFVGKWRESATLIADLARAVGHAHERGVLHRDLKPGNILFDQENRAYVCDFGLAKVATAGETTPDWTISVQLLGTPHYMAPEIAAGTMKQATTAGDIYALGVILYELLAGHLPFDADNVPALLRKIADEEPATPVARRSETGLQPLPRSSTLREARNAPAPEKVPADAGLLQPVSERRATDGRATGAPPRDLSAIAMKCLEKSPTHRYATSIALADDLEAWLAGKPVTARRLTRLQKYARWVQRNPVVAGLSGLLAAAIVTGGIVVTRKNTQLTSALGDAQVNLRGSFISAARLRQASGEAGQRGESLALLQKAAVSGPVTEEMTDLASTVLGTLDLVTEHEWDVAKGVLPSFSGDLEQWIAVKEAGPGVALRESATGREIRRFPAPLETRCEQAIWAAEAGRVLLLFADDSAALWDLTGQEPVKSWAAKSGPRKASFNSDGRKIAVWRKGDAEVISLDTGMSVPISHTMKEWPNIVSLSPDGKRVVMSDPGHTQCFSAVSGALQWESQEPCYQNLCCWSSDSSLVCYNRKAAQDFGIYHADSGLLKNVFSGHRFLFKDAQLSSKAEMAVSASTEDEFRLWDQRDGRPLLYSPSQGLLARISPDGDRVAWMPDRGRVAVSRVGSGVFREHGRTPAGAGQRTTGNALVLAPGGDTIFATNASCLMAWRTGHPAYVLSLGFPSSVTLRYYPDPAGEWLYTTEESLGSFRYRLDPLNFRMGNGLSMKAEWVGEKLDLPEDAAFRDFTDDGKSWIIRTKAGRMEIWPDGKPEGKRVLTETGAATYTKMSFDGKWFVNIPKDDSEVVIREGNTGGVVRRIPLPGTISVSFSRDGRWLAIKGSQGWQLRETGTWRVIGTLPPCSGNHKDSTYGLSDEGACFFAQAATDTICLYELPSLRLRHRLRSPIRMDIESSDYDSRRSLFWILGTGGRLYRWDIGALESELAKLGLARPSP